MSGTFFIPDPEVIPTSRVDLTFRLRSAMRYHREQTIPGLGGVWFVRQLSWAVAGLKLVQENIKESPIRVANAIEALGCKAEYQNNLDTYSFRGKRAFSRDQENDDTWNFRQLVQKRHYVQITYRQSTVRALPSNIGLGFVEGEGIRFNTMHLSKLGESLAEAFLLKQESGIGRGNKAVVKFLSEWIQGQAGPGQYVDPQSISQRLGPSYPTEKEKEIVLGRLNSFVTGGVCSDDQERRRRIVKYFKENDSGSWQDLLEKMAVSDEKARIHANHLLNAKAFEDMRLSCVKLLDVSAMAMENEDIGIPIVKLSQLQEIAHAFGEVTRSAEQYLSLIEKQGPYPRDAQVFASQMVSENLKEKLSFLLARDGRILQIIDGKVSKGPLFKTGFSETDIHDEETGDNTPSEVNHENPWVLNRLQQFHNLWLNCGGGTV
ncbi:MAG: hypothetical protein AB1724_11310 [Thermodesulfobacteriota bacterium]